MALRSMFVAIAIVVGVLLSLVVLILVLVLVHRFLLLLGRRTTAAVRPRRKRCAMRSVSGSAITISTPRGNGSDSRFERAAQLFDVERFHQMRDLRRHSACVALGRVAAGDDDLELWIEA